MFLISESADDIPLYPMNRSNRIRGHDINRPSALIKPIGMHQFLYDYISDQVDFQVAIVLMIITTTMIIPA
jgi:hypothetical protein